MNNESKNSLKNILVAVAYFDNDSLIALGKKMFKRVSKAPLTLKQEEVLEISVEVPAETLIEQPTISLSTAVPISSPIPSVASAPVPTFQPAPKVRVKKEPRSSRETFKNIEKLFYRFSASKLTIKDQTFFAKRLSFLVRADIPILESLHMLREETRSKAYASVLDTVIFDVSNGQFLSKSLQKFNNVFGDFAINIIKIGETSGILSQNLDYLADELRKKHALKGKVVGAFVYPAIITLATIGITVFLMVYLFPKIMPVFASLHTKLPLSTRIVIAMSDFVRTQGVWLLLAIVAFFFIFTFALKKMRSLRYFFDGFMLRIPLIGKMVRHYNIANGTRTLGLLLKSGITVSQALPITADTTQNLVYKKTYQELAKAATRGEKLSVYLKTKRFLFPDVLTQMVAVGERSGNLSQTLVYLSELYEAEVDDFTKNLSTLMEPVLMVVMGVIVGFIAVSIITPIYGITQSIHN